MTPSNQIAAVSGERGASNVEPGTAVLLQCLVVASDTQRRDQLAWAAGQSGWRPIPCGDADTAEFHSRKTLLQLAIVDLEEANRTAAVELKQLLERLTRTGGLLLIVCGNEGQLQEEIWARQVGVWMYLPGVGDASELTTLLVEARHIAQRLSPTAAVPWEQAAQPGAAKEAGFEHRFATSPPRDSRWGRRNDN